MQDVQPGHVCFDCGRVEEDPQHLLRVHVLCSAHFKVNARVWLCLQVLLLLLLLTFPKSQSLRCSQSCAGGPGDQTKCMFMIPKYSPLGTVPRMTSAILLLNPKVDLLLQLENRHRPLPLANSATLLGVHPRTFLPWFLLSFQL